MSYKCYTVNIQRCRPLTRTAPQNIPSFALSANLIEYTRTEQFMRKEEYSPTETMPHPSLLYSIRLAANILADAAIKVKAKKYFRSQREAAMQNPAELCSAGDDSLLRKNLPRRLIPVQRRRCRADSISLSGQSTPRGCPVR